MNRVRLWGRWDRVSLPVLYNGVKATLVVLSCEPDLKKTLFPKTTLSAGKRSCTAIARNRLRKTSALREPGPYHTRWTMQGISQHKQTLADQLEHSHNWACTLSVGLFRFSASSILLACASTAFPSLWAYACVVLNQLWSWSVMTGSSCFNT